MANKKYVLKVNNTEPDEFGNVSVEGGTTGDYIPLSGTEEGKPVTGVITGSNEFNKQGDRKAFAQLSDVYDSQSYSTNETKTGGTWIDGKPIYTITQLTADPIPEDIET